MRCLRLMWTSLLLHYCRAPEGAGLHISADAGAGFESLPKLVLIDTLVRGNKAFSRGGGGLLVKGNIDVALSNTSVVDNGCVCNLELEVLTFPMCLTMHCSSRLAGWRSCGNLLAVFFKFCVNVQLPLAEAENALACFYQWSLRMHCPHVHGWPFGLGSMQFGS